MPKAPSNWTVKPMPWFPSPSPPKGVSWDGSNWVKKTGSPKTGRSGSGSGTTGGGRTASATQNEADDLSNTIREGFQATGARLPTDQIEAVLKEIITTIPQVDQDLLFENNVKFEKGDVAGIEAGKYLINEKTIRYRDEIFFDATQPATDPNRGNSMKTIRHEVGHAVDFLYGQKLLGGEPGQGALSNSKKFQSAVAKDIQTAMEKGGESAAFVKRNDYYTSPTSPTERRNQSWEMFAETYSSLTTNSRRGKDWETYFPLTVDAVRGLLERGRGK